MSVFISRARLPLLYMTVALIFGVDALNIAIADSLVGHIGVSQRWGSGWIDFGSPTEFRAGEKLRIKLRQDGAKRVLVRLLPFGASPDDPIGIIGNQPFSVQDGVVTVTLDKNYANIIQLSVHGGEQPWNFSLGSDNGPATIVGVDLIK
jgi:hypothetical protein